MDKKSLCCHFPTTVLMVDDSAAFLGAFSLMLNERLSYCLKTSPKQALEVVQNAYQPYSLLEQLCHPTIEEEQSTFDLSAISNLIQNPKRFEAISVVVVDYGMPEMNGLEFCQQLAGLPVKKIMLTGEADLKTAITAFNNGLIDKFFLKDSSSIYQEINRAILELQRTYFENLTEKVIDIASSEYLYFLHDTSYAKLFNEVYENKKPVEYYLLDTSGSYLLINEHGKHSWLAVANDKEMLNYYDVAVGNEAPEDVLAELKSRSKILFSPTKKHLQTSVFEWADFMHSANLKTGKNSRYYYTTIA